MISDVLVLKRENLKEAIKTDFFFLNYEWMVYQQRDIILLIA